MELIKGKIYRDTPEQTETSTYLRFVGYDKKVRSADFELVKGGEFLSFRLWYNPISRR